jgi:hypothetical protein
MFFCDKDIIFTTAYKDIHRGQWEGFVRSNQTYLNYFYNLATHIPYTLVVYVEDPIKEMMKEHVFRDNILFVDMNNVSTFFDKYLEKDKQIIQSETFQQKIPPHRKKMPECVYAEYNLMNHSKINFVNHTKKLFGDYEYYAWIDFGTMNEKVENIPKQIDVSLLDKKITYHCLSRPPGRLSEEDMLKSDAVYFLGSAFLVYCDWVEPFEQLWESKIQQWQKKGITDDDQNLILQLYYDHPELFQKIENAEWFGLFRKLQFQHKQGAETKSIAWKIYSGFKS